MGVGNRPDEYRSIASIGWHHVCVLVKFEDESHRNMQLEFRKPELGVWGQTPECTEGRELQNVIVIPGACRFIWQVN